MDPVYYWLKPVYFGDDLYARQPINEAIKPSGCSFLLACKPSSHRTIAEYLTGIELDSLTETVGRGAGKRTHRYHWMTGAPLRADDAMSVNRLEVTISKLGATRPTDNTSSFITDLAVTRNTVAELAAYGRARWKIENKPFNVLKTGGYHLEHYFAHGKEPLASLLVVFNLLAFAMHNACDLIEHQWQMTRERLGARAPLFEPLRSITAYHPFAFGMNRSIDVHSASAMSLAYFNPCCRYWPRVISVQGIVNSMAGVAATEEPQPTDINQLFFFQALMVSGGRP